MGNEQSSSPVTSHSSLGAATEEAADVLTASLLAELAGAWQRGEFLTAETLLDRHPEVRANPVAAVRLIYEEVCLREERGQAVSAEEVVRRFPHWRRELEVLLDCHDLLSGPPATPDFPAVGEWLGGLKLEAELGRGSQGRVFLATQASLAGRPLVLKLTTCDNHEHFSLARLQHTHIVPLYWAEDFPERRLRMLCMPYLGGTTLARVLAQLWTVPLAERTGQDLLSLVTSDEWRGTSEERKDWTSSLLHSSPLLQLLGRTSYVQALCWIGACLADGLQYAHERGLVHLDLKPSNVLLAADGTPLLLDFHLAREPLVPGREVPEWFGGTPAYMSPEQRAAVAALGEGRAVPARVDDRSDVYSLGLMLYEALGGGPPTSSNGWLRLDHFNPHVSPGLGDIIHKCLERDPARRYASAALLAADLRRHLGDQPLRGVPNRSLTERWRKWRRRRPLVLPLVVLLAALLGVGVALWISLQGRERQHLDEAAGALEHGRQQLREPGANVSRALETLEHGRTLAAATPGGAKLVGQFDDQLRAGRRLQAARHLHETVRRLGFATLGGPPSRQQIQKWEASCRSLWGQRGRLLQDKGVGLSPQEEERLRTDLLDLATIWVGLLRQVHNLPIWKPSTRPVKSLPPPREALAVLEEVEKLFGPSPVLEEERLASARALGLEKEAHDAARRLEGLKPRTEWERYAVGRALLHAGKLPEAAAVLQEAVQAHPASFWANFLLGVAQFRRGRHAEAVHCFGVCIALAPRRAECYYNRGLAQSALGQDAAALGDYNRALQFDPGLAAAAQNRGLLHHRAGRYAQAEADLERARAKGLETAAVYYGLALAQWEQHKRQPALDNLDRALYLDPAHAAARILRDTISRQ
jgi:serine/threonine protein kinase/tetratricopeptide (TPR) repeat protein